MGSLQAEAVKEYPITLGETFLGREGASYHSLQYKFKPQSAGRSRPGSLDIDNNMVIILAECCAGLLFAAFSAALLSTCKRDKHVLKPPLTS